MDYKLEIVAVPVSDVGNSWSVQQLPDWSTG